MPERIVRRINLTNKGKKHTLELIESSNSQGTYKYYDWKRDGKYLYDDDLRNYRYYDKNTKSLKRLDTFGVTVQDTPYLDKLAKARNRYITKNDYIGDMWNKDDMKLSPEYINLRTKGKSNLATIPLNILDSISISAGRAGVPIQEALGLVGQESRFGEYSNYLGRPYAPNNPNFTINKHDLVNNHSYYQEFDDGNGVIYKHKGSERNYDRLRQKYKLNEVNIFDREAYQKRLDETLPKAEKDAKYIIEHNLIKKNPVYYPGDIMADAFIKFHKNPKAYNYNDSKHINMVRNTGNEVWSDKQIQEYYKTRGKKYYDKGVKEAKDFDKKKKYLEEIVFE